MLTRKRLIIVGLLVAVLVVAWNTLSFNQRTFYVLVPAAKSQSFQADFREAFDAQGFRTEVGSATDDKGQALYVVEGRSLWMRSWAQNLPMSGDEECAVSNEPHLDPNQLVVRIESVLPFRAVHVARVSGLLVQALAQQGYAQTTTLQGAGRRQAFSVSNGSKADISSLIERLANPRRLA